MNINEKKTLFSGIQPTGEPHIGVYFGAIKNWLAMQNDYNAYFCIVDLHAITVQQEPQTLRQNILNLAKLYIACGIDPQKSTFFIQSHVSEHSQLAWLINCFTTMGELEKMTQFKEKSANKQRPSIGLFSYPTLMVADILLYQTNMVPVGEDQIQHLELTRNLAERINNRFKKDIFTIPEYFVPKIGARIKGLQNPTTKMSKSSTNRLDTIFLLDDTETIRRKINKSITDTDATIAFDPQNKPGISNLIMILAAIENISVEDIVKNYKNLSYGAVKDQITLRLDQTLAPIREKFHTINEQELIELLRNNATKAKTVANKTLFALNNEIGFLN